MSKFTNHGRVLLISVWLLAVGSAPAGAGPLEDGQAAYDAGQLRKAYEAWLPLAEAGSCRAQFGVSKVIQELGVSYMLYGEVESDDSWAYRMFREGWKRYNLWFIWRLRAAQQGHNGAQQWFAEFFWDKVDDISFVDSVVSEEEPVSPPPPSPEWRKRWLAEIAAFKSIAWSWTLQAADNGHPDAMIKLATRAVDRRDRIQAFTWATLAHIHGRSYRHIQFWAGVDMRSAYDSELPEIRRRVAAWRAAHAQLRPWGSCE